MAGYLYNFDLPRSHVRRFVTTERNLNRVLTSVRNVAGCMSDGEVVLSPPPPHDRSWLPSTCHRTTTQYTLEWC